MPMLLQETMFKMTLLLLLLLVAAGASSSSNPSSSRISDDVGGVYGHDIPVDSPSSSSFSAGRTTSPMFTVKWRFVDSAENEGNNVNTMHEDKSNEEEEEYNVNEDGGNPLLPERQLLSRIIVKCQRSKCIIQREFVRASRPRLKELSLVIEIIYGCSDIIINNTSDFVVLPY